MKKLVLAFLLLPIIVSAQATSSSKLAWDEAGPDLATVQAYTYKYYPDGAATGTALANVTCTGTASPFLCTVAFPAFTPGSHTLTVTASDAAGESGQTAALPFVMVVIPAVPTNLKIQ